MFALRRCQVSSLYPKHIQFSKISQVGALGSGAGRGGGGGGSIRAAGGTFGQMEVAHEEEFFHKKQREQLKNLKAKAAAAAAAAPAKQPKK